MNHVAKVDPELTLTTRLTFDRVDFWQAFGEESAEGVSATAAKSPGKVRPLNPQLETL